ncbi:class I SAM-dependent methyltransferase [Mycolicibacterium iranicum]|uniref:Class I SAM-dependent methyltransferase n=1 Tax=Mycolicibacterium iranicum TaxID=912594 RepID=A0ABT4HI54_MYCIR|nr:class I SAM-dependent methyltransferase [Mycolicibacterium iranicum]MCZ0729867.1 class I SAM-dependent methyltransferase [Mycolicibacterium iranicum]
MSAVNDAMTGFDRPVQTWRDIPGWFQWREGQEEAAEFFADGDRFVEVGCYLGRSICSLAEVTGAHGLDVEIIGVDWARGSGPEGPAEVNAHGPAVEFGGGTMAGLLHRNLIACGAADAVHLLIADSVSAAKLFPDESLAWVHLDARHDYDSVRADIEAWRPKVRSGGWLSGDDYDSWNWPGVVQAVADSLDGAAPWCTAQWRWVKP